MIYEELKIPFDDLHSLVGTWLSPLSKEGMFPREINSLLLDKGIDKEDADLITNEILSSFIVQMWHEV